MNKQMPAGLSAEVLWDSSKFIDASIHEVQKTILEATIFVILVILLFLGSVSDESPMIYLEKVLLIKVDIWYGKI